MLALGIPAVQGALWAQQGSRARGDTAVAAVPAPSSAPSSVSAPARSTASTQVQSGATTTPTAPAVLDLLRRRSQAVLSRDAQAWLATVDPADTALVQRQTDLFARLAQLRATSWTYSLQSPDAVLPSGRRDALGPSAFLAHIRVAYRLAPGVGAVERDQHVTLVQRDGRWLVGGDEDGPQQRDLWDLGPIDVSRGRRSVVVAAADATLPASRTAAEADAAARRVDAVWGDDWPRWVVVMIPASLQDMATLLDRSSADGLSQLAAVTTGELRASTVPPLAVVRPATGSSSTPPRSPTCSALGRGVVLTHEFTHVATRASDVSAPPVWVDEGFADYVAYLDAPLGVHDIAGDLLDKPKALAGLTGLPRDVAFNPAAGEVGPAYAAAWLAMRFVSLQGGTPMVVDFYRVAAGLPALHTWPTRAPPRSSVAPRTPLEHACSDVVGYTEASFVRRWLVWVKTRAASS